MSIQYAWYSVKQAKVAGVVRYRTPDGKIVEATSITQEKNRDAIEWDDLAYIGEVVEFVDRVSYGEFEGFDDLPFDQQVKRLGEVLVKQTLEKIQEVDPKRWN